MLQRKLQKHITLIGSWINKGMLSGVAAFLFTTTAFANPVLDHVAAGNVSIQQTNHTTTVNQASQQAIINWQSFNIGAGEHTHFQQPTGGVALNRINPTHGASEIYGQLTATGQIILVNPAGFHFGPSAYVNVGGLIASTANISDQDFLNGYYNFNNDGLHNGAIYNQGHIIAADHGLVALIGGAVTNDGMIQANLGHAILASGDSFTMSFANNNLIHFSVDEGIARRAVDKHGNEVAHGVSNTGTILADGGQILVTAKAAAGVLDNVINMEGVAQARYVDTKNGSLILRGDKDSGIVRVAAKIDASGKQAGQSGGTVEITGHNILLDEGTVIDVSGFNGGGSVNIGGNYLGQGPLPNAHAVVMANANIYADATDEGMGGSVILWSDHFTNVSGEISARGGANSGDGGFIETSSKEILYISDLSVDTSALKGEAGMWLLDPADINIATSNSNITGASPFTATGGAAILDVNTLVLALGSGNVTVQTTNDGFSGSGNITVSNGITWTSANKLFLNSFNNIIINAPISGVNGSLDLSAVYAPSSITTGASGTIDVNNFNLLQGQWHQVGTLPAFNVRNDFQINSGALPSSNARFIRATSGDGSVGSPYVLADIYGFQGIGSDATTITQHFRLGNDIDASPTMNWNGGGGFEPIGVINTGWFTGSLNGMGYSIDDFYINRPSTSFMSMFAATNGATIENFLLINPSITGATYTSGITSYSFSTTYNNIGISGGSIIGTSGGYTGGIAGVAGSISINNSFNSAYIESWTRIGGFTGWHISGDIVNSYNTGHIHAKGNAGFNMRVAGLVGEFYGGGSIINSYSSGKITSLNNGNYINGMIGDRVGSGGAVVTITNSYWDTEASGRSTSDGGVGKTTAEMMQIATYNTGGAAWNITNSVHTGSSAPTETWFIFEGATRPMLMLEYSTNIKTPHQLQLAGTTTGANYTLANDIDMNAAFTDKGQVWGTDKNAGTTGSGFSPIGGFTAIFDGQNNTIDNLFINRSSTNTIGLFGQLTGGGVIRNLAVTNADITGRAIVGGITGRNDGSTLTSVSVTGDITGTGDYVGGITGYNTGTINGNTTVMGNISSSSTGQTRLGGLVGENWGNITATTLGDIYYGGGTVHATGGGGSLVGGLVGWNRGGSISNVYVDSSATITATSQAYVGGFIGQNHVTLNNVYSGATVNGGNYVTGGLIGFNYGSFTGHAYATGNVSGTQFVGGLIGAHYGGNITPASHGLIYATGNVSGTWEVGGLIGENARVLSNVSYTNTSGGVNAPSASYVGGLVGLSYLAISNSYAEMTGANVVGYSVVGGLVGGQGGTLTGNSYATGNVIGSGNDIGGLIGRAFAPVTATTQGDIYASGTVTGIGGGSNVGGVIGVTNAASVSMTNLVALNPSINAAGKTNVGGIVGGNLGSVINSYSTADITGYVNVGGVTGFSLDGSSVTNSYNTGDITGTINVGGVSGRTGATAVLTDVYSNATVTGSEDVGGIIGEHHGTLTATTPGLTYASGIVEGTQKIGAIVANQVAGSTVNNIAVGNFQLRGLASDTNFSLENIDSITGVLTMTGFGSATLDLSSLSGQTLNITLTGNDAGTVISSAHTGSIAFSQFESITASNLNDTLTLNGGTLTGNFDGGAGTNTLTAGNSNNTWTITSANGGTVTGIGGAFANVQNIVGGSSNDAFILNGNTFSGNIDGGVGGSNTLTANDTTNTWNITTSNGGTVNGITGTFANIQNLVGGSAVDTFKFTDGVSLQSVNGGDTGMNHMHFDTFSSTLSLTLNYPINGVYDAGVIRYSNGTLLTNFSFVQQSTGNSVGRIFLPTEPSQYVTYYDSTYLNGEIGDPFYFNSWIVGNPPPGSYNNSINTTLAAIVNQPPDNWQHDQINRSSDMPYYVYDMYVENTTYIAPIFHATDVKPLPQCYSISY